MTLNLNVIQSVSLIAIGLLITLKTHFGIAIPFEFVNLGPVLGIVGIGMLRYRK